MIELRGVSRKYGSFTALHPTDLMVRQGQTTVLIGPSGCGKSTLLRILVGLVKPTTGEVRFDGVRLDAESVRAIRLRTGYVIQKGGLFPHMTARANVALMARHLNWDEQRIRVRLDELAELVHLTPNTLARYPSALSGGENQRVSLMRALFLKPDVLLMDEPLGALDPMIRFDLQEELRSIFERLQKTVVVVTHDMAEAAFFSNSIALMRAGQVVQHGTMQQLLDTPATPFAQEFVRAQRGLHAWTQA